MSIKNLFKKIAKEESNIERFLKKIDKIGKEVLILEKEFSDFSKRASSKTHDSIKKKTAVLQEYQKKKRKLVDALKSLRANTINLEVHSINTINKTSSAFLNLVREEVPEVLEAVTEEEIDIQEEIIGFTEEEENIWAEIKSEAMGNIEDMSKPKIKKAA